METNLSALQSAELLASIVTGGITAGILILGGLLAFWRFFLQRPLGNNWRIDITPCKLRRANDTWAYFVTLGVQNASTAGNKMSGWWRQVRFPDEVEPGYDPNASLDVLGEAKAIEHYGRKSLVDSHSLASGERYVDHVCEFRPGGPKEFCYVEYTLQYRAWKSKRWKRLTYRWRDWEFISQIMTSPVERDDLSAVKLRRIAMGATPSGRGRQPRPPSPRPSPKPGERRDGGSTKRPPVKGGPRKR